MTSLAGGLDDFESVILEVQGSRLEGKGEGQWPCPIALFHIHMQTRRDRVVIDQVIT